MENKVYVHKISGNTHTCTRVEGAVGYFTERDEALDIVGEYMTDVEGNIFNDHLLADNLEEILSP